MSNQYSKILGYIGSGRCKIIGVAGGASQVLLLALFRSLRGMIEKVK